MALPIKSEDYEVVSGGASDPKLTAGTVDPTLGGGVAAAEGSMYLRFQAGTGEAYLKTGVGNTDWTQVTAGGGGASTLDEAYDGGGSGLGRTITADSGAVQINATTVDTQAGLFIDRSPGGSAAARGLEITMGSGNNSLSRGVHVVDSGQGFAVNVEKNASGWCYEANLGHASAQGYHCLVGAAATGSAIEVFSSFTGATGEMLTLNKIPIGATAGDGMSLTMGANASGDGLVIAHSGSGSALNISTGNAVIGPIGTPTYQGKLTVGDNANAAITVRNNAASAELNLGVDGTNGWLGTASNHPVSLYANDQTQWWIQTSGAFRSDRNLQAVETSIFDFSVEPGGAGTNGNYLAGGAGSTAAVSLADTGRIRYNESLNRWEKSENTGAYTELGGAPPPSTFERHASFGVNIGPSTQEATLGRITFSGSVIGLSIHAEDATTAGTLTVNVKVNGGTTLSAVLDSGANTESNFATASTGTHVIAQDDEVTVEVIANGTYDNTPSGITGVVINVTMVDGSGSATNPNVALLDVAQSFTAGQTVDQVTLSDGVGIVVNGDASNNFDLELTQNSTLDNPTNVSAGQTINIAIRQDGTGGFTLGYGSAYLFPGGTPTVTATALAEDIISCYVRAEAGGVATVMLCSIAQDHS